VKVLSWLYHLHFQDARRERLFLASVGFLVTFGIVRGVTHLIRAGVGPIHHLVWGILLLLLVGYAWLIEADKGWFPNAAAIAYGVGAALTLDEFALWLNLQDVYWDKQGRESIDAIVIFGALLSVGVWGYPFLRAVAHHVLRGKAQLLKYWMRHPEVSQTGSLRCLIISGRHPRGGL
jgi:hypothetical protein